MKSITIFRNRLREGHEEEYAATLARMNQLAASMPGYLGRKVFVAEDGERVSIIEFETVEHARAWGSHPEHRAAQRRGREAFYETFLVQTCELVDEREYARAPAKASK